MSDKNETQAQTEDHEPLVKVDRTKYQKGRSPAGKTSLNNGDDVAQTLEGLSAEDIYAITEKLKGFYPTKAKGKTAESVDELRELYKPLNIGMQRMNLGNKIRTWVRKRDEEVAKAEAEGKKPPMPGLEALQKAAAPFRKELERRIKEEEKAKAERAKKKEADAGEKAA